MKQIISHWVPAAFCAFLCVMALFGVARTGNAGWWEPAFFAFLPMCFFGVGTVTTDMRRQIQELKTQLAAVQTGERVNSPLTIESAP